MVLAAGGTRPLRDAVRHRGDNCSVFESTAQA